MSVPKLSQPVADWLLKTPEKPESPKQPLVFAPLVNSWSRDVVRDGSTQQWLLDIQSHPEVEEEDTDFEMINSSPRSSLGEGSVLNA